MKIKFIVVFLFLGVSTFSQTKKALKYFNQAQQEINDDSFEKAGKLLEKSIESSFNFLDAHLALYDIYICLGLDGEHILHRGYSNCNQNQIFNLKLAEHYYNRGEYLSALQYCRSYLLNPSSEIGKQTCEWIMQSSGFALQKIKDPIPTEIVPILLINSEWDEYFPILNLNADKLVFTRKHNNQEDIFISNKISGTWDVPSSHFLSSHSSNEGGFSYTLDSTEVYFAVCGWDKKKSKNIEVKSVAGSDCDIFYSSFIPGTWIDELTNEIYSGRWTNPKRTKNINSPFWDSQPSVSWDGNTLYFVSNRKGGKGGKDIWMSKKNENGDWTLPLNLSEVNTNKDEITPFIYYDNESLFFSSNGYLGLGKQDVFVSSLINDNFSNPYNLGFPINDYANQSSLTISFDRKEAYYSSDKKKFNLGGLDIYSFEIPEGFIISKKVALIKGIVNGVNKNPLLANITFKSINSKDIHLKSKSDGSFFLCLILGETYLLNVEKEGYILYSEHIYLDTDSTPFLNITLNPLEINRSSVLKNVFFEFDSDSLNKNSFWELNNLIDLMNKNQSIKIQIQGHTDNIGTIEYNYELSLKRANAVRNYIIQFISSNRISVKGFGSSKPIASNENEKERKQNRRIEILLVR